jgi:hypothetical protein
MLEMKTDFHEFVDAKQRKAKQHLELVKQLLERGGFQVIDKLEEREEPYIFIFNPEGNLSFEGIRVYEIGGDIAYRIQKESHTHPFGKAYSIPIEKMFDDLLGEDDMDDQKMGEEIAQSVVSEIRDFFEKSYEAEKKGPPSLDPIGQVNMRSTGTDYANKVTSVGKR